MSESLETLDEKWKAAADAVTTTQITLAKTDVSVRMLSLVWIPV